MAQRKRRAVDADQHDVAGVTDLGQLAGALQHIDHACQHHRVTLHVDRRQIRRGGDYRLRHRGCLVALPVGWLLDHLDAGVVGLHAVVEASGAIAAVDRRLITHHRQHGTLAAEFLANQSTSIGTHAQIVGPHDHRGMAAGRTDIGGNDRDVLALGVIERWDDGIAVSRHEDDPGRTFGD